MSWIRRTLGASLLAGAVLATVAWPARAQLSCAEAGYLCAAPAGEPLMRWPDGKRVLRILLPAPTHETPSRAVRYQQAAARGIMAWDRIPFELQVFERADNLEMDIVVEWESQLGEARIGETHVASGVQGNEAVFRVVRFALATRLPEGFGEEEEAGADSAGTPPAEGAPPAEGEPAPTEGETEPVEEPTTQRGGAPDALTLSVVELTAAHELGHALGLPHSDDPGDVMYPETSGARLSRRDIQTVRALYALPAGVRPNR